MLNAMIERLVACEVRAYPPLAEAMTGICEVCDDSSLVGRERSSA